MSRVPRRLPLAWRGRSVAGAVLLAVGLALFGPLAAGPLAAGPLAAGPLAAGPLAAGPLAAPDVGQAIPAPPRQPTAVPEDEELFVEEIRTDRYPRISMRFSIRPLDGPPPPYLEPTEVGIAADGVTEPPLQVYTVGRVPTSSVGTYEVIWESHARTAPGEPIRGRLGIAVNGRPEIDTAFSFIRPYPPQAEVPSGAAQPNALIPVPRPNPGNLDKELAGSLAAMLVGTALLVIIAGLIAHVRYRQAQNRLATWVGRSSPFVGRRGSRAAQNRRAVTVSPTIQLLGRIGAKLQPSSQVEKVRRNLVLAGRPTQQHYTRFVASKAGLGIVLFLVGFWLLVALAPLPTTLLLSGCMGALGFMLPSIWLSRAIKQRQYEMRKALPDALDLMTIGVSAGLAFDGAIAEIVEKWDNELSGEFSTMLGELRMGSGRRQALLNLADRTQVEEIQIMVSQLIQAEELGMSLTDTLLTLAGQMRLKRRQRAQELAQKAAVKMLIPLVFLIFPALFVVILGPAAHDMISFFTEGPK